MRCMIRSLLLLLLPLSVHGQERPAEIKAESKRMSVMLRSEPPERTLLRADSLLLMPDKVGDPHWRFELMHNRGHALRLLGRYDEAMSAQVRSFELADSLNDHHGRMDALLSMASIHLDLNDLDAGRAKLREVFRLHGIHPMERAYRLPLVMAAWCDYREMGDSALYWCNQALPLAEAARDSFVLADIHFNMGVTYGALGRPAESERAFRAATAAAPREGYAHLRARVNESLAYLNLEQGNLGPVPALLDSAERIAREHGAGEVLLTVLEDRKLYHLQLGDSSRAFAMAEAMLVMKDSLAGVFRERVMADAQARFGVSRMEKELTLARSAAEVNALRAQRSRIAWGALAIISVLAVVLLISFRRQYRLKKQAAAMLERDKERLLEENELLHQ